MYNYTSNTFEKRHSSHGKNYEGILCANCGGSGHIYRICNHPITSFGVVCYKKEASEDGRVDFKYLMVQRKDSLCFVEFIRGKYSLQNRQYILHLFNNMTAAERELIATHAFDAIWKRFWQSETNRNYAKEYNESHKLFDTLKAGYYLRYQAETEFFQLQDALNSTVPQEEAEWGFPKGRRNINESDYNCAIREFREETDISSCDIAVHGEIKPFEEVFTGCNKVRYKHVYYLARLRNDYYVSQNARVDAREISRVSFFTADQVLEKIKPAYVQRRELFRRLDNLVRTRIHNFS